MADGDTFPLMDQQQAIIRIWTSGAGMARLRRQAARMRFNRRIVKMKQVKLGSQGLVVSQPKGSDAWA